MRRILTTLIVCLLLPVFPAPGQEKEAIMLTLPALGEFWYRMETDEGEKAGEAQGYAHLVLSARDDGGLRADWEMKLAFTGGTHEEERTMDMAADGLLLAASISMKGKRTCEARRDGSRWIVTTFGDGVENEVRDVAEDIAAGLGFVIAAMMPMAEGASTTRDELNDAQSYRSEGEMTITVKGEEAGVRPAQ